MSTFDAGNYYFSGQGVVMLSARDANGNPTGYRPVGNVSALSIAIATTVVDHKGNQDGQRAIDARLQTETKPSLTMTIENWNAANLASALRGNATNIAAGTVANEAVNGYAGLVSGLQYASISTLVLEQGATTLVAFTNATTPYDYEVNDAAGSIMLNNPSVTGVAASKIGQVATALTVGATTVLTVPGTYNVGDEVNLYGFTGADAASVNGITTPVTAVGVGTITVGIDTTAKTITVGASSTVYNLSQPIALQASYSYAKQALTDALTQPLTAICMRFEGLNTAETNDPVVVEVFKFSTDPLKELALISDTFGQFQLEGELLADFTKVVGSKYFRVKSLKQ